MGVIVSNIAISNHPVTGFKRVLDIASNNIGGDRIDMTVHIYSLDSNNNRLDTLSVPMVSLVESATNSTLIDPATGVYVISDGNGGWKYEGGPNNSQAFNGTPMGEYDFFIAMLGTSVNVKNLMIGVVALNDSLGMYNV